MNPDCVSPDRMQIRTEHHFCDTTAEDTDLNLIKRKHQTNPVEEYSLQKLPKVKKNIEELLQIEGY